ncbi:MAG TPA: protein kinase, partial [Gemmatimonadales bacterium]
MSPDPLETLRTALSDRYRVERLLGAGGMATVYLAQDLKHDRFVAIKVLRPELSAILGPERFHREIQIAAKLNHPHILTLHDSGEAGGLLYYVMPYVDGESLLARLAREGQLPVADAVRIAREVASALAYAHGHGVVHRDIKPANILLSNGYAMVADFGLARAISGAKGDVSITQTGLAIGSPTYMSPEQSSSAPDVDGRSDIYSLGCVLYELLTGDPPFTASTPSALMARHVSTKPLPIRPFRPSVPAGVDAAVIRALEKLPADRYQKAEDFGAALAAAVQPPHPAAWSRWVTASALMVASVLLVLLLARVLPPGPPLPVVDTARYAVLPFAVSGPGAAGLAIEQLVQDALARWGGITVVDGIQVAEAVGRGGTGAGAALTSAEAARISGRLGAGRYIRGEVVPEGDSLRVRLALYAVGTTGRIRERSTRLGTGVSRPDSVLTDLTDQLIFPIPARTQQPSPPIGSRMLPALQSFVRADSAILLWNLEAADSLLSTALLLDPEYAQAKLWLALVRVWSGEPLARWQSEAQRAYSRSDQLSPRDRVLAEALVAQGNQDFPKACGIWRRLTRSNADSFVGWFGLATCLRRDQAVIPDPKSPSAWRFRSSYHEAVQAYRRAFELLPSIHFGLRSDGFMRLRGDILFTTGRNLRPGRALPPDTNSFYAYPEWSGDTLVFYPFPADIISRGATGRQEQRQEGVTHQRRIFLQIAQSWVASYPSSADALEALALSLELLGDASALDTLHRARTVAKSRAEALRV